MVDHWIQHPRTGCLMALVYYDFASPKGELLPTVTPIPRERCRAHTTNLFPPMNDLDSSPSCNNELEWRRRDNNDMDWGALVANLSTRLVWTVGGSDPVQLERWPGGLSSDRKTTRVKFVAFFPAGWSFWLYPLSPVPKSNVVLADSEDEEDSQGKESPKVLSKGREGRSLKHKPLPQVLAASLAKCSKRSLRLQKKLEEKQKGVDFVDSSKEEKGVTMARLQR
eukprot:Gb_31339 [translate_table: standard]